MSLFPLISVPDSGTADGTLPLPREVAWTLEGISRSGAAEIRYS